MLLASAVFSPLEYWPILAGFIAAVAVLLAFDLFVIERLTRHAGHTPEGERKRFRLSASWTVLCVLAALGAAWAFREFALHELTANPALLTASESRYSGMTPDEASRALFLEFLKGYVVEM